MVVPLPVPTDTLTIDMAPAISIFDKVKNAHNDHDYNKMIQFGSAMITSIQQLQLVSVHEYRAFALGMNGKFDAAVEDAETMIKYAPMMPQGYLRLGNLLEMQGKQARALEVYQEALDNVSTDDPCYSQFVQGKEMAQEKLDRRFDLFATLPLEIIDKIIVLLPEVERANLFEVSTMWSKRLTNCQLAWSELQNQHDDAANVMVVQALPSIAEHIKNLTISTVTSEVWFRYLDYMNGGHFKKIKSLNFDSHTSNNVLDVNSIMTLTNAFWTMRHTLTTFKMRITNCDTPLKIADILFYCPNLSTLALDTQDELNEVLGDLTILGEPHHSIVDLTIDTARTTGDALRPVLKLCPFVKRLRLEYARDCTFSAVCDECPNLEVFGFNTQYELPDSADILDRTYDNKYPILPSTNTDHSHNQSDIMNSKKHQEGRLRAFYSKNGGRGISGNEFMRLLQKNQKTVELLYVNLSKTDEQEDNDEPHSNFHPDYAVKAANVIKLDRLSSLTYWPDIYGVFEPLFLRTIDRSSIKHINPICAFDIPSITRTLMELPPLESLELTNIEIDNDNEDAKETAVQCLVQLFKYYAASSDPKKKLKMVAFEDTHFVSDDVLDALANIETLNELKFHGTNNFTSQELKKFFSKLKAQNTGAQITKLKLSDLDDLIDSDSTLLDLVSTMDGLETLYLNALPKITDVGIKALVDNVKGLHSLIVKGCIRVTSEETVSYVKSRKNFNHLEIFVA
ncbi:hypothetical protein BDA99DRAFT_513757 [Phascolomyces articulosus]|uniref:F-box domain-containing protein n=1 Tax=Phascolomyces articulosus TaxID=60185 RepID=A0AAD5K7P6_9FUNG|nr:hypothetical protein BDA99DRAFT_513757 [Phascolomyces articulosus]